MKHLILYEDHNTDSLYKDLLGLGLTDDRVIIRIQKVISGRRHIGVTDFATITFPNFNDLEGKIKYVDIADAIMSGEYDITPLKYGSEYGIGTKETVIKRIKHKMEDSARAHLHQTRDFEKNINAWLEGLAFAFSVKSNVTLLIDGKEIRFVDNHRY